MLPEHKRSRKQIYVYFAEQENPLNITFSYLLCHKYTACSGAVIQSAKRKYYCQAAVVYITI